jgi:hypothetical protein
MDIGIVKAEPLAMSGPVINVVVGSGGVMTTTTEIITNQASGQVTSASLMELLRDPDFTDIYDGLQSVELEILPRPVHELNCTLARSYLVKLLRANNKGQGRRKQNESTD